MKFLSVLGFSALAAASPLTVAQPPAEGSLSKRGFWFGGGGMSSGETLHEFTEDGCRSVIFIFARGTAESGNMGSMVGPPLSQQLKQKYGETNVATEGVDYAAAWNTNDQQVGSTDTAGITEMRNLLVEAANQCPNAKIVAGGYSQGAALAHRAIEPLSDALKERIVGVTTFGDTQNAQDHGVIPDFPADKLKVICNAGDVLCEGGMYMTSAHLAYTSRVPEAAEFLEGKIGGI
ncbi:cutinase-domain-containing protein [Xylariomycetidae sp. FL0641]|nr:cutinase-domain-containing protein [Xylariomycetidae sp. FL0641]